MHRINLTIAPWVSGDAVKQAYLEEKSKRNVRASNKAMAKGSVDLFDFVVRELRLMLSENDVTSEDKAFVRTIGDRADGLKVDERKNGSARSGDKWERLRKKWNESAAQDAEDGKEATEYTTGNNLKQTFIRTVRALKL